MSEKWIGDRRALMAKATGAVAGAAALGSIGRGNNSLQSPLFDLGHPGNSPPSTAYPTAYTDQKVQASASQEAIWDARHKLDRQEQISQDHRIFRRQAFTNEYSRIDPDLMALKSVSAHWRASVQMDREKARQTEHDRLRKKIEELRSAPGALLDDMIAKFLTELGGVP